MALRCTRTGRSRSRRHRSCRPCLSAVNHSRASGTATSQMIGEPMLDRAMIVASLRDSCTSQAVTSNAARDAVVRRSHATAPTTTIDGSGYSSSAFTPMLENGQQLANTEQKLQLLESIIDDAKKREGPVRDVEVR